MFRWFKRQKWHCKLLAAVLAAAVFLVVLNFILQYGVAHIVPPYRPAGEPMNLRPLLESAALTEDDYRVLYAQTGLAKPAVDDYLTHGDVGVELILATQEGYFSPPALHCSYLIPSPISNLVPLTLEERLQDSAGNLTVGVPLAPLRDGDILVSFSTHTAGFRHGHAGLVIHAARRLTLESVSKGHFAEVMDAGHWNTYATFMVLRPRALTEEQKRTVIDFALKQLRGAPYSLLVGLWGEKAPEPTEGMALHCAYLPWYAYMQIGLDLDAGGGRIVTVQDLARSPYLEVVQIYGVDPADYPAG